MKTKLIIFDNDGVLVDSESLIKIAQHQALLKQDIDVEFDWLYNNLTGISLENVLGKVQSYTNKMIDKEKYVEAFYNKSKELFTTKLKATEGILNVLKSIPSTTRMCIATSGAPELVPYKLEKAGLKTWFDEHEIFTASQVKRGKPAPDIYMFAADNMKVAPRNCIVVEDSLPGIQGANAAGMFTIGYLGGSHVKHTTSLNEDSLLNAGAHVVIHHHKELFNAIP